MERSPAASLGGTAPARAVPIAPLLGHDVQHPGCEVAEQSLATTHLIVWVHTGTARIRADRRTHLLVAGQAACIPAGIRHSVTTDAGSVAMPLFFAVAATTSFPDHVTVIHVPPAFHDWLVFHFETETGIEPVDLDTSGLHLPLDVSRGSASIDPPDLDDLAMPRSSGALEVARALRRDPALTDSARDWARRVGVGLRTMQEQFTNETGVPFSTWRTRNRLLHAARLLDAGHRVTWVGARVGFTTTSGFIRAFAAVFGTTPHRYARQRRSGGGDGPSAAATITTVLDALLAGATIRLPPIPARTLPPLVNDYHVVLWVYRGPVLVHIGARSWRLRTDSLLFIPAGVHHVVRHQTGAILLVVDHRHGVATRSDADVATTTVGPESAPFLLATSIANLTQVRPRDHDPIALNRVLDAFAARRRERSLALPAMTHAREVALAINDHPGDRRSLEDWAATLGADPTELGAAFVAETGVSFARWRSRLRMQVARELVVDGVGTAVVARTLGYAHPSALTTAFRRAYGTAPREYRRSQPIRPAPAPELATPMLAERRRR